METICKKTAYNSKEMADFDLTRIQEKAIKQGKERYPTRSYLCRKCNCWHLTSQDQINRSPIKAYRETKLNHKTIIQRQASQIEDLKQRLIKQEIELLTARSKKAKLKKENTALTNRISNLKKELTTTQGKLADKTKCIQGLVTQLNEIKNGGEN